MAQPSSDYHRGEMDIHEQSATYASFLGMSKWGSLAIAVMVLFPTIWFCTKAGFLAALITSVIVLVVGVLLLRGKSAH